jgi:CRP/FNR family cyclic AMP-dependent transcriptional regulator
LGVVSERRGGPGGAQVALWPRASLLARLPTRIRAALLEVGAQRRFRAGHVLMREGEHTTHVVLIRSGYVKITATTEDGDSALLAVRPPGDIIGELAALHGTARSATVTAPVEVTANQISRAEFLEFLRRHPETTLAITGMIGDRLRMANRRRLDIYASPTVVRVARILAELCEYLGKDSAEEHVVGLTQHELAELAGVADATVQRALRKLREAGLVSTGYRRVIVHDLAALQRLARGHLRG